MYILSNILDSVTSIRANCNSYDGIKYDAKYTQGINAYTKDVSYVAFNPEQIKEVTNIKPTNDPDIRFSMKEQVEETKDLIAIHNLTDQKLKGALELGGFPIPSIAIIKTEQEHEDFGDISVIFYKDTISPTDRRNKVFASDVYSPTFPSVSLKFNEKAHDKIRNMINKDAEGTDYKQTFYTELSEETMSQNIERAGGSFVEAYKNSPLMMLTYLKEKGIAFKPILKTKNYGEDAKLLENIIKKIR